MSANQASRVGPRFRGGTALSWERRFELDVWYVDHCSLWLDLRILLMTLLVVLGGRGTNQPGFATMTEFMGSESSTNDTESAQST